MQTALEMCERTDGALDVSIYPVLRAWGFTTGSYQVPTQEEIENLLTRMDYRKVTLENGTASIAQGMEVDLGSVAKGLYRRSGISTAEGRRRNLRAAESGRKCAAGRRQAGRFRLAGSGAGPGKRRLFGRLESAG